MTCSFTSVGGTAILDVSAIASGISIHFIILKVGFLELPLLRVNSSEPLYSMTGTLVLFYTKPVNIS